MRHERMHGLPSKHRDMAPADVRARFKEMVAGTAEGARWCLRAKISADDPNKAMRDPVIYRCNLQPHHRTGCVVLRIVADPAAPSGRSTRPTTLPALWSTRSRA